MVAISLYRGNLHRVPDVPRRWLMPTPKISLKDFRSLLRKREKALSLLLPSASSNPNANPNPNSDEVVGDNGCSKPDQHTEASLLESQPSAVVPAIDRSEEEENVRLREQDGETRDHREPVGEIKLEQREIGESDSTLDTKSAVPEKTDCGVKDGGEACGAVEMTVVEEEKELVSAPQHMEIGNNVDLANNREKKKKDLEQKLQVLNETKHNLVQMLKQILNAEEEIKRRNNLQASVLRPPAPLQLEVATDSGSNPHGVMRSGLEANCGDLEGESADVPSHNTQARHVYQMRITSPSAPSPLRKPALSPLHYNLVPSTSRPSLGTGGNAQTSSNMLNGAAASPSPSRFAPIGHQGHPANMPSLSVSGTHFSASSPSPAASGGTSVFRDARLTSPSWN